MTAKLMFKRFSTDDQGNVVLMFGLSIFTIMGALGGAIDLGRAMTARAALQDTADYAALTIAASAANQAQFGTSFSISDVEAQAKTAATQRAGELGAGNVTLTATSVNPTDYRVVATSVYNTILLSADADPSTSA